MSCSAAVSFSPDPEAATASPPKRPVNSELSEKRRKAGILGNQSRHVLTSEDAAALRAAYALLGKLNDKLAAKVAPAEQEAGRAR
jgi:hypothetical protein